jgi:hypothetical protein
MKYLLFSVLLFIEVLFLSNLSYLLKNKETITISPYPEPFYTPGLVDTYNYDTLNRLYNGQTYSQFNRQVTDRTKDQVCRYYNCTGKVEIDHFIPLALGGSNDISNLWAEPEHISIEGSDWGFHSKDTLESYLIREMKKKNISPKEAQDCIKNDWIACYKKYFKNRFGAVQISEDEDDEVLE